MHWIDIYESDDKSKGPAGVANLDRVTYIHFTNGEKPHKGRMIEVQFVVDGVVGQSCWIVWPWAQGIVPRPSRPSHPMDMP